MFLYIYIYSLLLLLIWLLPMILDDDNKIKETLNKTNQIILTIMIIVLFIIHKVYDKKSNVKYCNDKLCSEKTPSYIYTSR